MKISKIYITFLILLGCALSICIPADSLAQPAEQSQTDIWVQEMLDAGRLKKQDKGSISKKKQELEQQRKDAEAAMKEKNAEISKQTKEQLAALGVTSQSVMVGGGGFGGGSYVTVYKNSDGSAVDAATSAKIQEIENADKAARRANAEEYAKIKDEVKSKKKMLGKVDGDDDVYIYTDEKGVETYFKYDGKTLETVYGTTKGCTPLPAKLAELESCIFCPMFEVIFDAAQKMATNSYSVLSGALSKILLIGFAIFIAFKVLLHVSSFTKQDGPKFITELLVQAFKVMVAFLLLTSSYAIYNYVIGPVLDAGLDFGTAMLFDVSEAHLSKCLENTSTGELGVLPNYLFAKVNCFLTAVQQQIAVPQSIAASLICVGMNAASGILWDFEMILQGILIYVFTWLVMLAFAFYLIDATVRLGIVGTLIPFLIACWPFKVTQKYTSTGWTMFMNTFFTFVFMGLVITVNVELIMQALSGAKGGKDAIVSALTGDNVEELKALLSIGLGGFLVLIACCIFGFKLTAQATELAGNMAGGGGGTPIGSRIGGLAASAATSTAKAAGGAAGRAWNATGGKAVRKGWDKGKAAVGRSLGIGRYGGKAAKAPAAGGGGSVPPPTPNTTTPNNNGPQAANGNNTPSNVPPIDHSSRTDGKNPDAHLNPEQQAQANGHRQDFRNSDVDRQMAAQEARFREIANASLEKAKSYADSLASANSKVNDAQTALNAAEALPNSDPGKGSKVLAARNNLNEAQQAKRNFATNAKEGMDNLSKADQTKLDREKAEDAYVSGKIGTPVGHSMEDGGSSGGDVPPPAPGGGEGNASQPNPNNAADRASYNTKIREHIRSAKLNPPSEPVQRQQFEDDLYASIKAAEEKGISNTTISGQGYSYKTDAVGDSALNPDAQINYAELNNEDKQLYDSIVEKNKRDGTNINNTFAMAKAYEKKNDRTVTMNSEIIQPENNSESSAPESGSSMEVYGVPVNLDEYKGLEKDYISNKMDEDFSKTEKSQRLEKEKEALLQEYRKQREPLDKMRQEYQNVLNQSFATENASDKKRLQKEANKIVNSREYKQMLKESKDLYNSTVQVKNDEWLNERAKFRDEMRTTLRKNGLKTDLDYMK